MQTLQSAFGVFALLAIAWAISEHRRAVSVRQAGIGLAATFITALVFLKVPQVASAMAVVNRAVDAIAAPGGGRVVYRQRRRHCLVPGCEDWRPSLAAAARRQLLGVAGVC
jgi:CNT family concentrative nucleoside transporter